MNNVFSFGNICSLISASRASSISSFFWQIIDFLWPWNWIWISLLLFTWVIWEIITRHGSAHYNSENGFSPVFNRFIGSGVYFSLQALVYLFFRLAFGDVIYCAPWPYAVHIIIFLLTGTLLHLSGFWPYLRSSQRHRRRRR